MEIEFILLVFSLLFFTSIITDKIGSKFGVPALLLFLLVGMLFGSDGIGLEFDNISVAQTIGTCALCIILFSGGMDTKMSDIRPVIAPGLTLATLGVVLTAGITGVVIWGIFRLQLGTYGQTLGLATALLIGATMSSTDSASVFSILRSKGVHLKHGLKPLLELESGSNDPMAYILTITMISIVTAGEMPNVGYLIGKVILQLVIGGAAGFLLGKGMVWLMNKITISNDALYPIWVLTACIFIFSITYFAKGNSYLAVYIGGLVIGNSPFTHKRSTKGFFNGLTWLSQLVMFLTLGLLVEPHNLLKVAIPGLIVSFVVVFVARPLAVFGCLLPFRQFKGLDKLFVSWVGLRGAVPIIFAILCQANGVPQADLIFNIVFFCTLFSLVVQGISLPFVAKATGLAEKQTDLKKPTNFDIDLPEEIKSVATEIQVTGDMLEHGDRLMDMGFPQNTLVIMVKRQNSFFVPTGKSVLQDGDALLVITDNEQTLQETYTQIEKRKHWKPVLLDNTYDFLREYARMVKENCALKRKNKAQKKQRNAKNQPKKE